jgi:NAD(P)H-quinone oxidoreductase subunit 5
MNTFGQWVSVAPLIAVAIPAVLTITALISPRRAGLASGTVLTLAVLFTVGTALGGGPSTDGAGFGVRADAVTCVMLLLVGTLGAIIVRYSRSYLHGDPGLVRYLRWLLVTLGSVTALVIANNLMVLAIGWTATSLALHQLLVLYRDRTPALVAAHKKFLVSRLADICFLGCLALVHRNVGSLDIDRLAAWTAASPTLTPSMQLAAVLAVMAVALRSAQLPFHGWLTQVMEAPTPVSALLHAGVVNIGGFVLIRLAPLIGDAVYAQLLLIVVGLISAVAAALVMTTRVSVKVALAWSTCAQVGFMLVQCGLGLWQLALLHLVAHSLYKAHAFLSAGTAVDSWRFDAMTRGVRSATPHATAILAAAGCATLCVAVVRHMVATLMPSADLFAPGLALLLGLSVVPLVVRGASRGAHMVAVAARVSGVVLLYVGWHVAAAHLTPMPPATSSGVAWALVVIGFLGLFAVKTTMETNPDGWLARTLYPWLFAGLYLDESFTRLTFRIWPPRLDRRTESTRAIYISEPLEVQA